MSDSKNKDELDLNESKISARIGSHRIGNISKWAVFLFVLVIVAINLISLVFPALIASNNSTLNQLRELGIESIEVNSYEIGVWASPAILASLIVFTLTFLYFKKKLPGSVRNSFNFIFNFEISKKVTVISLLVILSIYVAGSVGALTVVEHWEDFPDVKKRVDGWSPEQIMKGFEPHVRYFLLWSSMQLFGNYTIIPFIASISLLVLTYFFTVKITNKRFAGVVSTIILAQSHVFLTYDSTVAYTNFWILFYLLSLYLVHKAWSLSPITYLVSMLTKVLTVTFLPMSIYFILRSNISRNKKIITAASSVLIIVVGIMVVFIYDVSAAGVTGKEEEFNSDEFWLGFTSFAYQLRFDGLILIFILPLIVGLFIASRKGILHSDSIMILIGGILLTAPLLTGFTEQTNQPYRFVPLVVFFAVGVGVLLSKKT